MTRFSEPTGESSVFDADALARGRSARRWTATPNARPNAPLPARARAGNDCRITARLRDTAHGLAAELSALGIGRGEVVSWMLPNGIAAAGVFLGAMHGGYVASPISLLAQDALIAHTLRPFADAHRVFGA